MNFFARWLGGLSYAHQCVNYGHVSGMKPGFCTRIGYGRFDRTAA